MECPRRMSGPCGGIRGGWGQTLTVNSLLTFGDVRLQTAAGVRFTGSRGARFRRWPGAASTRARVVHNAPAVTENNDAERVGE